MAPESVISGASWGCLHMVTNGVVFAVRGGVARSALGAGAIQGPS